MGIRTGTQEVKTVWFTLRTPSAARPELGHRRGASTVPDQRDRTAPLPLPARRLIDASEAVWPQRCGTHLSLLADRDARYPPQQLASRAFNIDEGRDPLAAFEQSPVAAPIEPQGPLGRHSGGIWRRSSRLSK